MRIRVVSSDDKRRCPVRSLDVNHYRNDGSCRCLIATTEQILDRLVSEILWGQATAREEIRARIDLAYEAGQTDMALNHTRKDPE